MPKDEIPIVEEASPYQGLYLVTMHAAVTLSPLVCKLVAQELIDEKANSRLTPIAYHDLAREPLWMHNCIKNLK